MLHINIIAIGKIKENYLKEGIEEYKKRLSRFCDLKITELIDEKIPQNASVKEEEIIKIKEGNSILKSLDKEAYKIVLDLKGKECNSVELAETIEKISLNNSNINFIIGGSLGLSEEVIKIADAKISFSKLTFPHQLMRVFLLEQIYRSFKILNNEQYHK